MLPDKALRQILACAGQSRGEPALGLNALEVLWLAYGADVVFAAAELDMHCNRAEHVGVGGSVGWALQLAAVMRTPVYLLPLGESSKWWRLQTTPQQCVWRPVNALPLLEGRAAVVGQDNGTWADEIFASDKMEALF